MNITRVEQPSVLGGQVPLLKHAIMQWLLLAHERTSGHIKGDAYDIANDTKASPSNVARALWDLQKQGLITFSERKKAGTNGHGSSTVLTHFELTQTGLKWTERAAMLADMKDLGAGTPLNPAAVRAVETEDLATEMRIESDIRRITTVLATMQSQHKTPAQALADFLRYTGHPVRIADANTRLGYAKQSTALYAFKKSYPDIFAVEQGMISFTGPEDWVAPVGIGTHPKRERMVDPALMREARASVALDGETQSVETKAEVSDRLLAKPELGPEIKAVLARSARRAKVAEAVSALEAAGLDDDALTVLGRIPDDTAFEAEVVTLLRALGYA